MNERRRDTVVDSFVDVRLFDNVDATLPIKIRARRQITTGLGTIKQGEVGFVPKGWIEKVISNRGCSCKGSINWFTYE